nr:reverse transcriptase domain, reverse transcriptase zinc-binding domain protein [Tanacetum cinerariifolium]
MMWFLGCELSLDCSTEVGDSTVHWQKMVFTGEGFKQVSSLVPSIPKSTTFFCNILNALKAFILHSMPFGEGALSVRDITRSGFSLDDLVNNLIFDGVWRWPLDWLSRDEVLQPLSVSCAWDTIWSRADMVNWYNVDWFPQCIPRHAIHCEWKIVQKEDFISGVDCSSYFIYGAIEVRVVLFIPYLRFFPLGMDTLSKISEYLNNLEAYMDAEDSFKARKGKVKKGEKELELFEALEHKSVVVESEKHRVVVFTKAPPRAYSNIDPFLTNLTWLVKS